MESSAPPLSRTAPTDGLQDLLDRPGPFLTAVLETQPDIENAAQLSAQRWRAQREAALADGAPAAALAGVDDLVPDAHHGGAALYAIVDADGAPLVVEHLTGLASSGAMTRWADLPDLVPLLADRQLRLPHVVVRCDREGADVLAVDADGQVEDTAVKTGDTRGTRHARSVGWQELRGWHRARRHLETSAEGIASAVVDAAAGIGARLVAVAGDDETVAAVVERLQRGGLDARAVAGGRGRDGSSEQVDAEVLTLVRTVAAEHQVEALQRFKEQLANGLAADGDEATLAALAEGRVDVLLVHEGSGGDAVVDGAVRAAMSTSAGIVVVPAHAGPRSGLGALLRW
jgi:hypothetical protein